MHRYGVCDSRLIVTPSTDGDEHHVVQVHDDETIEGALAREIAMAFDTHRKGKAA